MVLTWETKERKTLRQENNLSSCFRLYWSLTSLVYTFSVVIYFSLLHVSSKHVEKDRSLKSLSLSVMMIIFIESSVSAWHSRKMREKRIKIMNTRKWDAGGRDTFSWDPFHFQVLSFSLWNRKRDVAQDEVEKETRVQRTTEASRWCNHSSYLDILSFFFTMPYVAIHPWLLTLTDWMTKLIIRFEKETHSRETWYSSQVCIEWSGRMISESISSTKHFSTDFGAKF